MVSIELFIYANYYCYHPIFTSTLEKHGDKVSVSAKNVLAMSCCFESVDSRLSGLDLVKMEALCNCRDKIWGSFLCILALSSVTNRIISLMYPDCGEVSFKLLFNQIISPRLPLPTPPTQYNYLYLLFCSTTLLTSSKVFKPNHFAPLIFKPISKTKRKASALLEKANKKIPHVQAKLKGESSTVNISNFFQPVSTPASNKAKQFILPKLFSTTQTQSTQKVPAITSLGLIHNPKQELLQSFSLDFSQQYPNDVRYFREKARNMNDSQKLQLIHNVFKPNRSYPFPKSADGRSFLYSWLEDYSWLCYSPSLDGAFCLPCVLFGDQFPNKNTKIKKLFSEPMTY